VIRHYNPDGSDVETPRIETFKNKPFVVVGTAGAEIIAELMPWEGEPVIIKKRWSAFFKTDLLMLLNEKGIDTIVVGGIFTPNCVRATVYDAIAHDLDVIVLVDGTASAEMDVQDANILDMINIGVKMISCEELQGLVEWKSKV
jgi:nicotinamidase-related amidase